MSNGKTHEKINLSFLAAGIAIVLTVVNKDLFFEGIFVVLGYILGTYLMNPDLDLRSRPFKRWGVFRFLWIPYQTFNHRSVWTHGYVISDIIRYAYLSVWYVISLVVLSLFIDISLDALIEVSSSYFSQYKTWFFSLVFGNILSSTAHTLTDKTSSTMKRIYKVNKKNRTY